MLGQDWGCRLVSLLSIIRLKAGIHRQASLPSLDFSWTEWVQVISVFSCGLNDTSLYLHSGVFCFVLSVSGVCIDMVSLVLFTTQRSEKGRYSHFVEIKTQNTKQLQTCVS